MKNVFKKTKGSFLADVVVSMGILMMSITASLSLLNQSIHTNSVNKNKIIALNLAREGIEGVRLIRDTNWLRYGTKKRICWNFWNNTDENSYWEFNTDERCTELPSPDDGRNQHPIGVANQNSVEIGIKSYVLTLDDINYNWTLVENFKVFPESGDINSLINTCSDTNLTKGDSCNNDAGKWGDRLANLTNSGLITSRLYLDKFSGLYTHNPQSKNPDTNIYENNYPTDFYREVFIEYPLGQNGFHPLLTETENSTIKATDNQMLITVNVWYKGRNGAMKKITLETELTDYLERTNWSD